MKTILLLLFLVPSLAFGQVLSRPGGSGTFTGPVTAPGVVSTGTVQTKGLVSTALTTPTNATFTAGTGTLPNATYYARIAACNAAGCTDPSTETSLAITTGGVNYNWGAVTGATTYKVYCRTTGAEQLCATVTAPTVTWLDNGSVTPSGAIPALASSANVSTVSGVTARDITTSAASGAAGVTMVSGSRLCVDGAACTKYVSNAASILSDLTVQYLRANVFVSAVTANSGLYLRGSEASDGTARAVQVGNLNALTAEGDEALSIYSDAITTKVGSVYASGSLWLAPHAIGTCGDATNPEGKITIVPGATTVATKFCICTYTPTGTVYAWVNLAANSAGTGIGDTTTCP